MRAPALVLIAFAALALGACPADGDLTVDPDPEDTVREDAEEDADLSGVLGGDPQLEGGCAWLAAEDGGFEGVDDDRVEPLWPEGYRVEFDPLRLLDPDGEVVAEEGDRVHVDGAVNPDVMTICQIGPAFEVEAVVAVDPR